MHFLAKFEASSSGTPKFQVHAFFRLTYSLADDLEPSDHDLLVFAHWNVIFNAWPYFREYVSSTVNRAGLPRMMLPVLRVPRASTQT